MIFKKSTKPSSDISITLKNIENRLNEIFHIIKSSLVEVSLPYLQIGYVPRECSEFLTMFNFRSMRLIRGNEIFEECGLPSISLDELRKNLNIDYLTLASIKFRDRNLYLLILKLNDITGIIECDYLPNSITINTLKTLLNTYIRSKSHE